jgi:hypothetical protein
VYNIAAFNKIILEAPTMTTECLLKFKTVSKALVEKHALSNLDRVGKLLNDELRRLALDRCAKSNWKISERGRGDTEADFD